MSNSSLKEQLQAVAPHLAKTHQQQKNKKPIPNPTHSNDKSNDKSKNKPKWLDYVQYGVELLKAYFPLAFKNANEIKPLKKGIKQDLVIRLSTMDNIVTDDKACMVKSLAYYVNTPSYHKNVIAGAVRIDLDGNASAPVTDEEAKYSHERYQSKLNARQQTKPSKPNASAEIA